jgi:hypothetical protein
MEITAKDLFENFLMSAGFEVRDLKGEHWYNSDKQSEMDKKRLVYRDVKENEEEYALGCGETGYSYFFAAFTFDKDTGALKEHCIGE